MIAFYSSSAWLFSTYDGQSKSINTAIISYICAYCSSTFWNIITFYISCLINVIITYGTFILIISHIITDEFLFLARWKLIHFHLYMSTWYFVITNIIFIIFYYFFLIGFLSVNSIVFLRRINEFVITFALIIFINHFWFDTNFIN